LLVDEQEVGKVLEEEGRVLEQEVEKVEQEVEEEEEPGMVWRLALLIVNDVEVTDTVDDRDTEEDRLAGVKMGAGGRLWEEGNDGGRL